MFTLRSCHWFIGLNLPSPQISVILLISVSRFDATRKDGWIRREAAREGIGNLGFMSFKAENKVLHWVFGAHSHEGWHQWSGTLVAIPKAIKSIFLWSLSLADRWRNLWNLWSFRSTERGLSINNQSRKDLEDVLEAFNFKSYQIRSEVTERKQAHGFNVENEDSFWKLIGNVGCRLDSHLGYGHTIIPTMGDQRDSRMSLCSRCAGTHTLPIKLALNVSQSVLALACNEGATNIWQRVFMTLLSFTPKMPTLWHCPQKCPKPPPLHLAPVAMHLCLWPFHPCSWR